MPAYRDAAVCVIFDGIDWSVNAVIIADEWYPTGPVDVPVSPRLIDAGWVRLLSVPAFIAPSLRIAQQLCLAWAVADGFLPDGAKATRVPARYVQASPQSPKFGPGRPIPHVLAVHSAHQRSGRPRRFRA